MLPPLGARRNYVASKYRPCCNFFQNTRSLQKNRTRQQLVSLQQCNLFARRGEYSGARYCGRMPFNRKSRDTRIKTCVAVDFGSTYTKVALLDVEACEVVASAKAASTVETDVNVGLQQALAQLESADIDLNSLPALACSSAAGGLRVAVIGLVPELSLEAARRAALGAGAKIIRALGYKLTRTDIQQLGADAPEIILLVGGTDGGDEDVVKHNAGLLADSALTPLFILAGNRTAMPECEDRLRAANKDVVVTDNLLPTVDVVNAETVRALIRDVFMTRIIHAKGIDRAKKRFLHGIVPTPAAVLRGAELLGSGTEDEPGLGELLVVDVGGATTDVHSIARGIPVASNVILKGLPEPYAKRTVEGDLGLRVNAPTIVERVGLHAIGEGLNECSVSPEAIMEFSERAHNETSLVPTTTEERWIDCALARSAVSSAVARHAGTIEVVFSGPREVMVQRGKDLRGVQSVIGAGGIFAHGLAPQFVLAGARANPKTPESLCPSNPQLYVDAKYVLYAIGLLADLEPTSAVRIGKKYLQRVSSPEPATVR